MAKTLLTIILITASLSAKSACTIRATVKKPNAKTVYVNGVSLSKKVRAALKSQCKINIVLMSKAELLKIAELSYQRKLAKIKAGK